MESRIFAPENSNDSVSPDGDLPSPAQLVEVPNETIPALNHVPCRKSSWTAFFRSLSPLGLGVVDNTVRSK